MGRKAGMLTAAVLAALLVVPGASPTTSDDVAGTAPTAAWGMPPHGGAILTIDEARTALSATHASYEHRMNGHGAFLDAEIAFYLVRDAEYDSAIALLERSVAIHRQLANQNQMGGAENGDRVGAGVEGGLSGAAATPTTASSSRQEEASSLLMYLKSDRERNFTYGWAPRPQWSCIPPQRAHTDVLGRAPHPGSTTPSLHAQVLRSRAQRAHAAQARRVVAVDE
jgi:hypothetical protein